MGYSTRLKRVLTAYLESCTFDNWKHIHDAERIIAKIFWIIVQLILLVVSVYFVYISIVTYLQGDVSTSIVVKTNQKEVIPFPSVQMCKQNPFKTEELAKNLPMATALYASLVQTVGEIPARYAMSEMLLPYYTQDQTTCIIQHMSMNSIQFSLCNLPTINDTESNHETGRRKRAAPSPPATISCNCPGYSTSTTTSTTTATTSTVTYPYTGSVTESSTTGWTSALASSSSTTTGTSYSSSTGSSTTSTASSTTTTSSTTSTTQASTYPDMLNIGCSAAPSVTIPVPAAPIIPPGMSADTIAFLRQAESLGEMAMAAKVQEAIALTNSKWGHSYVDTTKASPDLSDQVLRTCLIDGGFCPTALKPVYKLQDLMKECTFSGDLCSNKDFAPFATVTLGLCYMYNRIDLVNYTVFPLNATRAGIAGGLTMRVSLPSTGSSFKRLTKDGLQVYLTVPGTVLLPEVTRSFTVAPGYAYNIAADFVTISRLPDQKRCVPARPVTAEDNIPYYYPDLNYDTEGCLKSCKVLVINKTCGCTDPKLDCRSDDMHFCSATEQKCMSGVYNSYSNNELANECNAKCLPVCDEQVFTFTQTSVKYPSENFVPISCASPNGTSKRCLEDYRDGAAIINVYYPQLTYQTLTEQAAYTPVNLFTDISNSVGLYLGMGTISVVEILFLPILIFCACDPQWVSEEEEKE